MLEQYSRIATCAVSIGVSQVIQYTTKQTLYANTARCSYAKN